ncbi:MAG: putative selenium-dependent hydroxylase accessory protein YqeC [Eubacterium sp.]|nr:putative selenium-dependent hydroxylase accessory protein YqeC [Eubacterium sp.]
MQSNKKYYIWKNLDVESVPIEEAFAFFREEAQEKPIISLVGGGGKTSTMYAIAEGFWRQGKRVLVTTTTHIRGAEIGVEDLLKEQVTENTAVFAKNLQEVEQLWQMNRIVVIGTGNAGEKVSMPESEFLSEAMAKAETVIIEADGAKCLPCKVPIENEPVLLSECNVVVGVMGMDALGQPATDICFRYERAKEVLGFEEGHQISQMDMARILVSEQGTRKGVEDRDYYIVLNKCDTSELLAAAGEIAGMVKESLGDTKLKQVVCSCYQGNIRKK